jgi:hypothetical protein
MDWSRVKQALLEPKTLSWEPFAANDGAEISRMCSLGSRSTLGREA